MSKNNRCSSLIILVDHITPRLEYVAKYLSHRVDKNFQLRTWDDLGTDTPSILYSGRVLEGNFIRIHPSGLLNETGYAKIDVSFDYCPTFKVKLFTTEFDDFGFDIFSGIFFLLTRMEEYWGTLRDAHDRYLFDNSIANKLGFIKLPVVDYWVRELVVTLQRKGSDINLSRTHSRSLITFDIDHAWAYKNKGLKRVVGGMLNAILKGDLADFRRRFKACVLGGKDPYDTYEYINSFSSSSSTELLFFFLLGDYGGLDKNVRYNNEGLKKLIHELSLKAEIGIHPSYKSYLIQEQVEKEIKRLGDSNSKCLSSRQHFLRMKLPDSYALLERVGVRNDYSMGYAETIGFRASTSYPYKFYSLIEERELDLMVHPFAVMDGTLNEYMKCTPERAIEEVRELKEVVESLDGQWICVWHNNTVNNFREWSGWRQVFEACYS